MHISLVRPILTYGFAVCWPTLSKPNRVRRTMCMDVTGSCQANANNIFLYSLPFDLYIECTVLHNAARFQKLEAKHFGPDFRHIQWTVEHAVWASRVILQCDS